MSIGRFIHRPLKAPPQNIILRIQRQNCLRKKCLPLLRKWICIKCNFTKEFMLKNFKGLPNRIKVGNKYIGEGEPAFFIAEIGNNHNGDYFLAKKTVEEAAKAGADAVKFQKRFIDEVFAKELQEKPQTKDQIFGKTYGEYRQALELTMEEFLGLKKHAEGLGVIFFATPFDHKS